MGTWLARNRSVLSLHGAPMLLQLGVPVLLLWRHWYAPPIGAGWWLAQTAVVYLYLAAIYIAGVWVVVPQYAVLVFAAVATLNSVRQAPAMIERGWKRPHPHVVSIVLMGVVALTALVVLGVSVAGRVTPSGPVIELEFPLRDGTYFVVGGGSTGLINPHLMTLNGDRFRAYRGQSYGVDLLETNMFGLRAGGFLPRDPARYVIYGDAVHAPCAGRVIAAVDGIPDMPPPEVDRQHMAGNHVLIECGGAHILLGHLKPGTVRVRSGERLTTGAGVGEVGNSGNSNEPHLHIHAQRPAAPGDAPFSGEPLPIRFSGRFLVRNDRVSAKVGGRT